MKDLILKASVSADIAKDRFVSKVRSMANGESGDIVQTILIIAMFVLIVVVVGGILYTAISGQASKVGTCIAGGGQTSGCTDYQHN
jgi:hypothetical protein